MDAKLSGTHFDTAAIVAGVDVGGAAKGFHAVALRNGAYLGQFASSEAAAITKWCREIHAQLIAVDAPCRWSTTGRARLAERQLMKDKIWCYSTPTRENAEKHPKSFYGWMLAGAELYKQLQTTHALFTGARDQQHIPICFETFPHAVVCALCGEIMSAKNKRTDRPRALRTMGITLNPAHGIDTVDAALCALTAHYLATNSIKLYGDAESGLIVVPDGALASKRANGS